MQNMDLTDVTQYQPRSYQNKPSTHYISIIKDRNHNIATITNLHTDMLPPKRYANRMLWPILANRPTLYITDHNYKKYDIAIKLTG